MTDKLTIAELEELTRNTEAGRVSIKPGGEVVVGPTYIQLNDRLEAAEAKLEAINAVLKTKSFTTEYMVQETAVLSSDIKSILQEQDK